MRINRNGFATTNCHQNTHKTVPGPVWSKNLFRRYAIWFIEPVRPTFEGALIRFAGRIRGGPQIVQIG